ADNYSALRYGERWQMQLDGSYRQILREHLHTPLGSPNLSSDISAALAAVEQSVADESFDPFRRLELGWTQLIPLFLLGAFSVFSVLILVFRHKAQAHTPNYTMRSPSVSNSDPALERLAERFGTMVDRLCARVGEVQLDPAQKVLYQEIRLGLLRLRRGNTGIWLSAYTREDELNRLERQLADIERSLILPLSSVASNQRGSSARSLLTVVDQGQLQLFRQALQAAAQRLWKLEWALAEEAARVSEFDIGNLPQRLTTLLFDTSITNDSLSAAITAAQAIEYEAKILSDRWLDYLIRQQSARTEQQSSRSDEYEYDSRYPYDYGSGSLYGSSSDSSSSSSDSGWGSLGGGDESGRDE
uniref:hypothetical protein n=2 Tax=uncultured Chloroflexus sp. TaxID=214040 RepID=UPI0026249CBC